MIWLVILLVVSCGLARRGAGGGFVEWGITRQGANNEAHGLGAVLVAMALSVTASTVLWMPVFAVLWFAATKPTPHQCFKLIERPFTWGIYRAATGRMLYFMPLALAVYYCAHGWSLTPSLIFLTIFAAAAMPYYVGMRLLKDGDKAVVFGEWGYSLIGIILWGVAL